MQMREAIEEYRYAILDHARKTQALVTQRLYEFVSWCEGVGVAQLEVVKPTDVAKFLETVRARRNPQTGKPLSSYTVHGYAATVKAFLNWAAKEELIPLSLPRWLATPRIETKVIEVFTDEQVKALFKATEHEKDKTLEIRDHALLSVMLDTGARAGEICGLTLDCVFLSPTDAFLKLYGKGSKWREVGLGKQARTILHRYLTRYRRAAVDEKHVFLNRHGKPLTVSGIDQLLERLNGWARITGVRCSAHTMRHTFALNYLKNGGDIHRLSRLMGQTSVSVTEGYLRAFKQKDARNGVSVLDSLK